MELCNWAWEMKRWADEAGKSLIKYSELRHESCQFSEKEWSVFGILSWGHCYSVREFFDFKPASNKNSQQWNRNWRETDRIDSQWTTDNRNESTAGQLYNKESNIITTIIISSNYWRALINLIGTLEIRDGSLEKGGNVVPILWLLSIFHSIFDTHWLASFSIYFENRFDAEFILNLPDGVQVKPRSKRSS